MKAERERLKPVAANFKQELGALCKHYGVEIDHTSHDCSDWGGVTGFALGFTFVEAGIFFELED